MTTLLNIEEASLNAWPALQTVLLDGWLARFADGYTKRANSVTPLYGSTSAEILAERVQACQALYARQGVPLVFRLPTVCGDSAELDALLARHGFAKVDRTLVQVRSLDSAELVSQPIGEVLSGADGRDEWLDAFHALAPYRKDLATHRRLLQAMTGAVAPLVIRQQGQIVACGLGVAERDTVGLFDLVVATEKRRQGLGRGLVDALLAWGSTQGATTAYLQVMADNAPALALYEQTGFDTAYEYWYRVAA